MNDAPKPPVKPKFHVSVFEKLRGYFLAGVLVTAPVSITLYLTWLFVKFVDRQVAAIIPEEYYPQLAIPGLGLLIAIAFLILIGWFAKNILGRIIIRVSEYILHKMPIIRTFYSAIKQLFETVMGSQAQAFREVVMYRFPGKDIWSIGFVTGTSGSPIQDVTPDELVNVYFPFAMNMTSGALLFIPRRDLQPVDIKAEDAFKLILSGGILTQTSETK